MPATKIENVEIVHPWNGKCATTGLTMDEYNDRLGETDQHDRPWEPWIARAAVGICRAYGIRGLCDPAYIANVITNTRDGVCDR